MSINYTVTTVKKNLIVVVLEDGTELFIPVKTWVDKDWIEHQILLKSGEEDLGDASDLPLKVGDTGNILTYQERVKIQNESMSKQQEEYQEITVGYEAMRRISYPFIGDTIGALVKAVVDGNMDELKNLNDAINKVKTDIPKDPEKKYTQTEYTEVLKNSPRNDHIQPRINPIFSQFNLKK